MDVNRKVVQLIVRWFGLDMCLVEMCRQFHKNERNRRILDSRWVYIHVPILGKFQGKTHDIAECAHHKCRFRIGLDSHNSFGDFHLKGEFSDFDVCRNLRLVSNYWGQ